MCGRSVQRRLGQRGFKLERTQVGGSGRLETGGSKPGCRLGWIQLGSLRALLLSPVTGLAHGRGFPREPRPAHRPIRAPTRPRATPDLPLTDPTGSGLVHGSNDRFESAVTARAGRAAGRGRPRAQNRTPARYAVPFECPRGSACHAGGHLVLGKGNEGFVGALPLTWRSPIGAPGRTAYTARRRSNSRFDNGGVKPG